MGGLPPIQRLVYISPDKLLAHLRVGGLGFPVPSWVPKTYKKQIVFGNDEKSRWDLTAATPNFHTMATDGIRFDLVDQIPPFALFLPSYLAELEVMK